MRLSITTGMFLFASVLVPTHARAIEPATIAAAASLASAVIGAGAAGSSVPMAMAEAQLQATIEVHNRLDNIEDSIINATLLINNLPEEFRKIIKQELLNESVVRFNASVGSFNQRYDEIKDRYLFPVNFDDRLVKHYEDIRTARNDLINRSDMLIPSIINAFAIEMACARVVGQSEYAITSMKSIYIDRFKSALDPLRDLSKNGGSLVWILEKLKSEHADAERVIAEQIFGKNTPIRAGVVKWFEHSLYKVEKRKIKHVDQNNYPFDPISGDRSRVITSYTEEDVNVSVHNKILNRIVYIDKSWLVPEVYRIRLVLSDPIINESGLIEFGQRHSGSDDEYERPFMVAHEGLLARVTAFNERADAIEKLTLSIDLVKSIIINSYYGIDLSSGLLRLNKSVNSQLDDGYKANSTERRFITSTIAESMTSSRLQAKANISESLKRIKRAVEHDQSEAWRAKAVAVLGIVSASMQFADALEAEMAAAEMQALARAYDDAVKMGEGIVSATDVASPNRTASSEITPHAVASSEGQIGPDVALTNRDKFQLLMTLKKRIESLPNDGKATEVSEERLNIYNEATSVLNSMKFGNIDIESTFKWIEIDVPGLPKVRLPTIIKGVGIISGDLLDPTPIATWQREQMLGQNAFRLFFTNELVREFDVVLRNRGYDAISVERLIDRNIEMSIHCMSEPCIRN